MDASFDVSMASASGRTTSYHVEQSVSGDKLKRTVNPDGTARVTIERPSGVTEMTAADGTVTTRVEGADPRFGIQAPIAQTVTQTTPGFNGDDDHESRRDAR